MEKEEEEEEKEQHDSGYHVKSAAQKYEKMKTWSELLLHYTLHIHAARYTA